MTPQFYGCYILRSKNPQYADSCYIGFTVNPAHRLKQHNGNILGGANRTHVKRPWEMEVVVYGFPNSRIALQFEWCWQNPEKSTKLKHVNFVELYQGTSGGSRFWAKLRVMHEMLTTPPWSRLSLRLCIPHDEIYRHLLNENRIPAQCQVAIHPIQDLCIEDKQPAFDNRPIPKRCTLCPKELEIQPQNWFVCPKCKAFMHLRCLANRFIMNSPRAGMALIPTKGVCPLCRTDILWRNVVELRNQDVWSSSSNP